MIFLKFSLLLKAFTFINNFYIEFILEQSKLIILNNRDNILI